MIFIIKIILIPLLCVIFMLGWIMVYYSVKNESNSDVTIKK